jgi:hypothetical protein
MSHISQLWYISAQHNMYSIVVLVLQLRLRLEAAAMMVAAAAAAVASLSSPLLVSHL